ncbi:MAG: FxsA family protein [Hyphomicrobium sp.]
MRFALPLAVLALPLLEIALLIKLGQTIGVLGVLAMILGTAVIGIVAIRSHGMTMARRMTDALESRHLPAAEVLDGGFVVLAGMLLVAPGPITDTLGALLLIPPLRRLAATWAARVTTVVGPSAHPRKDPSRTDGPVTIEGEYSRVGERDIDPGGPQPPARRL